MIGSPTAPMILLTRESRSLPGLTDPPPETEGFWYNAHRR